MKLRKDERLQLIQKTAIRHITSNGYENTTLEGIAEELGYTKQALYYYFKSKEDMVKTILLSALEEATERMNEIFSSTADPVRQLRTLIDFYVDDYFTRQSFFNIYYQTMRFQHSILNPEEKNILESGRREMAQRIIAMLQAGIDQKKFKDMGANHLGAMVLGMISGVLSHGQMPGLRELAPEEIKKNMMEILMNGIRRRRQHG